MSKVFTVSILGYGSRGHYTYGKCMTENFGDKFKIVSVCDIDPEKMALAAEKSRRSGEGCKVHKN